MRLICLKQLSEAGPSLVLFATCPRGRQLWSNHFFIYFLMLVCLPCIHDIKPIFSVSHKQRDWTRSSFVCCLSQARGRLVVNFVLPFFLQPCLALFASNWGEVSSVRKPSFHEQRNLFVVASVTNPSWNGFLLRPSCFYILVPLLIILFIESIKVSSAMKMMIDLTACLPTAPEVSEVHGNCLSGAGVWNNGTGRVSIKGGINHDTISSHSVPGRGAESPKQECSAV